MEVLDSVSTILKEKGREIWSIAPDATVYNALQTMAEKGVGALLVLENGQIVGVLSERDYARKIILRGKSSRETPVSEIMNSPAITISQDCPVDEAMRTMTEHRVRHLPVLDGGGTLAGVISIGDLVKWIITSHEKTIEQLKSYISGQA
jgi:CBS domain-containing protein